MELPAPGGTELEPDTVLACRACKVDWGGTRGVLVLVLQLLVLVLSFVSQFWLLALDKCAPNLLLVGICNWLLLLLGYLRML
jgi:hypothetical protein